MEDELLTIKEVAEFLKLTPATIHLWVRQNKIPYHRLSVNTVRFSKAEIIEFVKQN